MRCLTIKWAVFCHGKWGLLFRYQNGGVSKGILRSPKKCGGSRKSSQSSSGDERRSSFILQATMAPNTCFDGKEVIDPELFDWNPKSYCLHYFHWESIISTIFHWDICTAAQDAPQHIVELPHFFTPSLCAGRDWHVYPSGKRLRVAIGHHHG